MRASLRECGFDLVGFAPPRPAEDAVTLLDWLRSGHHASMSWLARAPEARIDPRRRFPWARTIVCCALSYASRGRMRDAGAGRGRGWISRYAWGRDYHKGMRRRLRRACEVLRREGATRTRPYVDTGALLERSLHRGAGLGWIGKNTCLLNEDLGSWIFLGEILTDLELEADAPAAERCGSCTACIEACPTRALIAPGVLDARLCISYHTIENRGEVGPAVRAGMGDHLFGCDMCQEVCPWNREARVPDLREFRPRETTLVPELEGLAAMSAEAFHHRFAGTAVRRARYEGFLRNVCLAMGNAALARFRRPLEGMARHPSPLVREHAGWALERLEREEVTHA